MMKIFTILISFFFCINLNAQKEKLFLSSWHENGNAELNIPSDKYSYFEKGKIYYFLSNDNDNIYIDIKIEDPGVQNRILKQGLTVWIKMDRKPAKKMGIRFPIGSQNSESRNKPNLIGNNTNADGSLVTPLSLANTIELISFTNEEARRFPSDNADNFRGSVKYDNEGTLHYKMIMPIAKLPVRNSKDGDGAMPFTFGIEYGVLPVMNSPRGIVAQPPSSGPPSGGSRGGSPGGGRSGGGAPGGRGQGMGTPGAGSATSQNTIPPVLLWIKNIKLATDK
jgi:hypothetical protein